MVIGLSKKKKGKGLSTTSTHGNSRPSSSRNVHHSYTSATSTGRCERRHEALNSIGIQRRQGIEHEQQQARIETMSSTDLQELEAIRAGENPLDNDDWEPYHQLDIDDVLSGEAMADVSHGGGEFVDLLEMGDDWVESKCVIFPTFFNTIFLIFCRRTHARDYRTRRDRNERRTRAFSQQLPTLVDAYMACLLALGEDGMAGDYTPPVDACVEGNSRIWEVDLFREYNLSLFILAISDYSMKVHARSW